MMCRVLLGCIWRDKAEKIPRGGSFHAPTAVRYTRVQRHENVEVIEPAFSLHGLVTIIHITTEKW